MPVITPQDFTDALFGAFNTYWAARTEIVWPNKPFDASSLSSAQLTAYVRPTINELPEGERPYSTSVSPQFWTREGVFQLEIFTRGEGATDRSNELVEDALQFVERPPLAIDGAIFRRRGRFTIGFTGVWYQDNVTAAFLYFTDRAP